MTYPAAVNDRTLVLCGNNALICSATDLDFPFAAGARLKDVLETGAESEQFNAQHKRVAFACGDCSLLSAFSQHFDIFSFKLRNGVPPRTPPESERSRMIKVRRLAINLNIFVL